MRTLLKFVHSGATTLLPTITAKKEKKVGKYKEILLKELISQIYKIMSVLWSQNAMEMTFASITLFFRYGFRQIYFMSCPFCESINC